MEDQDSSTLWYISYMREKKRNLFTYSMEIYGELSQKEEGRKYQKVKLENSSLISFTRNLKHIPKQ